MELADRGNYGFITYKYYGLAVISRNYTDAAGHTNIHMSRSEYNLFAGLSWGFRLVQVIFMGTVRMGESIHRKRSHGFS